jgi:hypothetical protein
VPRKTQQKLYYPSSDFDSNNDSLKWSNLKIDPTVVRFWNKTLKIAIMVKIYYLHNVFYEKKLFKSYSSRNGMKPVKIYCNR